MSRIHSNAQFNTILVHFAVFNVTSMAIVLLCAVLLLLLGAVSYRQAVASLGSLLQLQKQLYISSSVSEENAVYCRLMQ